jgi:arylsulfatase
LGLDLYYDSYIGRRALQYLAHYQRPEPWFCWVSFGGPHEPWDAPVPYDKLHPPGEAPPSIPRISGTVRGSLLEHCFSADYQPPVLTSDEVAALRANYAGNVTLIDDQIGAIVEYLKRADLYDDTLIIFTSDHGEMNGDHGLLYKGNFLSSAIDIPLIIKPPKDFPLGDLWEREPLVELIDVGTTIFDYIGVQPAPWMQGRTLRPIIEGRIGCHRSHLVSEVYEHTMIADRSLKCEFNSTGEAVFLASLDNGLREKENLVRNPYYKRDLTIMKSLLFEHKKRSSQRWTITLAQR